MLESLPYREVWCVDFEFFAPEGERPQPVCLVARELRSARLVRLWQDELLALHYPPYPVGEDALFVAYFASAELGCHLALGWPLPCRVLDCYTEFRAATNGLPTIAGRGLVGAMIHHGLDSLNAGEKDSMRELAIRGGPWTPNERKALLDYCQSDVDALAQLLPAMVPEILARARGPDIALAHALLRGRAMSATARMEHTGTPIDVSSLARLRAHWDDIRERLIERIDQDFGVYEAGSFRQARFETYLAHHGIPWPRLDSGALDLRRDTFREQARAHPRIAPLRELRHALSELRMHELAVGSDGRNRTLLSPFGAKSGRYTPRASRFIFGPSRWLRGLIRPEPGRALAYVDYSSQEIGIAAALSGDAALADAYRSGDPYLSFAVQAGLAPPNATKTSHPEVRERCKAAALGVNYGMGEQSLAARLGESRAGARELLETHRLVYREFWRWADTNVDCAMLTNLQTTVFGWPVHTSPDPNPRSARNFPMQGNGAEMLRLACCLATEAGLQVCAPVHDAILLEASTRDMPEHLAALREYMAQASHIVLDGFEIRTDAKVVHAPERYMDEGGEVMWDRVMGLLAEAEASRANCRRRQLQTAADEHPVGYFLVVNKGEDPPPPTRTEGGA